VRTDLCGSGHSGQLGLVAEHWGAVPGPRLLPAWLYNVRSSWEQPEMSMSATGSILDLSDH